LLDQPSNNDFTPHDRELLGDAESMDQLNLPHQSETEDKPKSPEKMEDIC